MANPLRTIQWITTCAWHPHFCLRLLGPLQTGRRGRTSGSHCRLKMLTWRGTASSAPTLQPLVHCISSSSVPCDLTVTTCLPSLKKKKNNCSIQVMHTQKLRKFGTKQRLQLEKTRKKQQSLAIFVVTGVPAWQSQCGVWRARLSHHHLVPDNQRVGYEEPYFHIILWSALSEAENLFFAKVTEGDIS